MRRCSSWPWRSSSGKSSGKRTTNSPDPPTSSDLIAFSISGIASPCPRTNWYGCSSRPHRPPSVGSPHRPDFRPRVAFIQRLPSAALLPELPQDLLEFVVQALNRWPFNLNPPSRESSISGRTSKEIEKVRSRSGSYCTLPTSPSEIGLSSCWLNASRYAAPMSLSRASRSTSPRSVSRLPKTGRAPSEIPAASHARRAHR